MFFSGKSPYCFVTVGLFLGLSSRSAVKCSFEYGCQQANRGSSCTNGHSRRYAFFDNLTTWEDAKAFCSKRNETLVDFSDDRDLSCFKRKAVSEQNVWIGLTKTNATIAKKRIKDYLLEVNLCECANISGHFKNFSCTGDIFPSICLKRQDKCDDHWVGNGSHCYLPVYDKMTWYGAIAHCQRLNSTLYEGNASKDVVCDASLSTYFWTRNLYKINLSDGVHWTWNGGARPLSSKLKRWNISIPDMACGGCGYWRNGTIYLITNCSQNLPYFCNNDARANSTTSNQSQLSWKGANAPCVLVNNSLEDLKQANASYWIGIFGKSTYSSRLVENLRIETDKIKLKNCSYLPGSSNRTSSDDCDKQNHFICVMAVPSSECPNNWRRHNGSCFRVFSEFNTKWKYADAICHSQHGSHLANLSDIKRINAPQYFDNDKRYWINKATIKSYSLRDPLEDWRWLDGTQFNDSNRRGLYGKLRYTGGNRRCAMIRVSNNVTIWKDSSCLAERYFICKSLRSGSRSNRSSVSKPSTSANATTAAISKLLQKDIIGAVKELLRFKPKNGSKLEDAIKSAPRNPSLEEKLAEVNKKIIGIVNSGSFNISIKETIEEKVLEVEVLITSLRRLRQKNETRMTIPFSSIEKNCLNQSNCIIKMIEIQFNGVVVNSSKLSSLPLLEFSDIYVLDYIAGGNVISKLENNETISLNFNKKRKPVFEKHHKIHCAYLDNGKWGVEGMNFSSESEKNIECQTDHLSSFTMVVLRAEVGEADSLALQIIFYIGCALSLAGLVFSCAVYIMLRKDLKILTTTRLLVHFNLQIALGLTQIGFLAGGSTTPDGVPCKIVAIILHYFTLTGFTWILLEVALLYLKLISVYGGEFVRMKYFYLFGWGFPLVFVGLSAGLHIDGYGTDQWCWLSYEDGFIWIFFAPVIFMTSVTVLAVIAVARVLFDVSKSEGTDTMRRVISAARGVIILFPTLGLCWTFSIIAVNHDSLVWKYLFAIFASIQGFFIFVIYGVCNTEIRKTVARKMGYDVRSATTATEHRS